MQQDGVVLAWTDGSCDAGDRAGGWCFIIMEPMSPFHFPYTGFENDTTSQRMEMMALLRLLQFFSTPKTIVVHSDSAYLINTIKRKWIDNIWRKNGWKNSKGGDVANRDIWEQIDAALKFHTVSFVKIKGHTGERFNEMADQHAKAARKQALNSLTSVA